MKKIMILVAALGLLVACGGNSEKKQTAEQTVEQKAVSYMEQIANTTSEDEALAVMMEMGFWIEELSPADQAKGQKATEEWAKKNPKKAVKLYRLIEESGYDF
jgi:hypothetical protein